MANILDKFKSSVIGSDNRIADYDCVISPKGDFTRIEGINVILNSWMNILRTPLATYDHDPEYGSELYRYIFEPADDITRERIDHVIRNQLLKFEDRASIESITIDFLTNGKGFSVSIVASYRGETESIQITFNESSAIM